MQTLWNDTFKLDIAHRRDPFDDEEIELTDEFKGSLKGAIRYFLSEYGKRKGHFVANFYNSKGEWLKEIGW